MTTNERPSWQEHAACRHYPLDLFFPASGHGNINREAKKVCSGCSVKDVCLEWALVEVIKFGIWGGTSERERRIMRRDRGISVAAVKAPPRRDAAKCGTPSGYARHRRDGEMACDACLAALRDYKAEYNAAKRHLRLVESEAS